MLIFCYFFVKKKHKHINTLMINILFKLIKYNKYFCFLKFILSN